MNVLTLAPQGDREIVMTRRFEAPPRLVWDAHTKPELVKRWLGVRGGWILAVCEIDLRKGGLYRYVWRKESRGLEMGMGGVYWDVVPVELLRCTEKFDDAWYPGEAFLTFEFLEQDGGTLLRMTMQYDSPEAREAVLATPMERGMAESYDGLESLLAALE